MTCKRTWPRCRRFSTRDYTTRFRPGFEHEDRDPTRKPLSPERSLGSVIKLLTPTSSYTDEYNDWLASISPRILALVFLIKRFYRTEWGDDWRSHLSVDEVDGAPAHELKLDDRNIVASYLRVGFDRDGKWRTFKLRQDYIATEKVQMEDDITASVVVPAKCIDGCGPQTNGDHSIKLVKNCEYRLFQRPDDAIHPGFDRQTELDMAQPGNFLANFEPLARRATGAPRGRRAYLLQVHRAHAGAAAHGLRAAAAASSSPPRTRAWSTARLEESALPADASRPGEAGAQVSCRDGHAALHAAPACGETGCSSRPGTCVPASPGRTRLQVAGILRGSAVDDARVRGRDHKAAALLIGLFQQGLHRAE